MWGGTPRFFAFQDTATLSANMAEPFTAAIGDSPFLALSPTFGIVGPLDSGHPPRRVVALSFNVHFLNGRERGASLRESPERSGAEVCVQVFCHF